jgi:hypothetical protein
MAKEIATREWTDMWDLVLFPPHVRTITCKWVYKVMTHSDGSPEHYKTHLVTCGFQQEHMTTIPTLLAIATVREWSISQFDVKNVFFNGELHEDAYMSPSPGYSIHEGMVCHLRRSLYGLKKTPRAWFQCFVFVVTAAGFSASAHDPALFVHVSSHGRTLLLRYMEGICYMEDMIITGDNPKYIVFVKAQINFLCMILVLCGTFL